MNKDCKLKVKEEKVYAKTLKLEEKIGIGANKNSEIRTIDVKTLILYFLKNGNKLNAFLCKKVENQEELDTKVSKLKNKTKGEENELSEVKCEYPFDTEVVMMDEESYAIAKHAIQIMNSTGGRIHQKEALEIALITSDNPVLGHLLNELGFNSNSVWNDLNGFTNRQRTPNTKRHRRR